MNLIELFLNNNFITISIYYYKLIENKTQEYNSYLNRKIMRAINEQKSC